MAQLRALAGPDGLQTERVRQAAAAMGVSERTLWRWLRTDPVPEPAPRGYRLSTEDLDEYMARRGDADAVWRARGAAPGRRSAPCSGP